MFTRLLGVRYTSGVAAIFAAVCIVAAPPATAEPSIPQGKIDTLLLSDDDISSMVGLPMRRSGNVYQRPGQSPPLSDRDDCRSFVESDVNLWSGEFTAFRLVLNQDSPDQPQFTTAQFVATYPSALVAATTFRRGFPAASASRCGAVTLNNSANATWRLDGVTVTGNRARWMMSNIVNGQETTWRCANEVRQKGNVMFFDVECQFGNGGPLVAQMANAVSSRIQP